MKKSWVFIAAIVGLLTIGTTGSVILAQEDTAEGGSPLNELVSRVAAILGIDEGDVQAAFDQAQEEIRDEALERRLAALVEQGRLTETQADEYREWYHSRPERIAPGMTFGKRGGHGYFGLGMRLGRRGHGNGRWAPIAPPPAADASVS